ncbi:MAG: NUDIX hydrolase [Spirochaetia bacterium]
MKRYSFCPVCGSPYPPAGSSPAAAPNLLPCPSCGFEFWQNSKPAVGALVVRVVDGRPQVLLTRRGIEPHKGMWDLPGGYLENGELPEAGLARELQEELGTRISRPRLFTLGIDEYPRDDVAQEARFVLSIYYRCEIPDDARLTVADDVAEAAWVPLERQPAGMAFGSNMRALAELRAAWEAESSRAPLSG